MTLPRLAVLMASYNSDNTIHEAVQSILQSKTPLHLFIVDDASRNPVTEVLTPLPKNVTILRNAQNLGLTKSLNVGLREILKHGNYEYIARMDADDISHPDRFPRQMTFLAQNPDVALLGCRVRFIEEKTKAVIGTLEVPLTHDDIKRRIGWDNVCFIHSAIVMKADALRESGFYDESFRVAQDYEIVSRLTSRYRVANLPEYLVDFRKSTNGITARKIKEQRIARVRTQLRYFQPTNTLAWLGFGKTCARLFTPTLLVESVKRLRKS